MKALFLDRDGTINRMVNYHGQFDSPRNVSDIDLVEGIIEVIRWANARNILVIEVSNQPGVAKGKISQKVSNTIEKKVHDLLKAQSAHVDYKYICPHKSDDGCSCRKPKTGLFIKASKKLAINLNKSVMLGDKASDAEAGKTAGCKTIIYFHKEDEPHKITEARNSHADFKVSSLKDAIPILEKLFF